MIKIPADFFKAKLNQIEDELRHQLKPIRLKTLYKKLGWNNYIMFEMMVAAAADKNLVIIEDGKIMLNTKGNRMLQSMKEVR